ncbi:hypothetical protein FE783_00990 [Paenibacillus mesophilus]|uniref:hypothetical protein n=1 Tax=Paenibacillus mesophilus TaxID=2582849 RepID=UPI00110D4354|nr:hypothetical protein [Paenibacillus mesophilus]TMV52805.1 hypothetical protein FE783_00990 [Paenibacillus mesophilus]
MNNRIHSEEKAYMDQQEELEHSGKTPIEPKTLSRRKLLASMGMAGVAMAVTGYSLEAASERGQPAWPGQPGQPGNVQVLNEWNETVIRTVHSISELIQQSGMLDGQIFEVISYHDGMNMGGDLFMWSESQSKSLHDGGYFIDPTIAVPNFATFNTYYAAKNSTGGVWVRLNNKSEVAAENYGLSDNLAMVWNCAAITAALNKAKMLSNGLSTPKKVILPSGLFHTTNAIELALSSLNTRVVPLIGQGRFKTELRKTTNHVISNNYPITGIDAVIFVHPTTAMGASGLFGEYTEGMTLSRTSAINKTGYGYYAKGSPIATRRDIGCTGHEQGYWQDDCWMSQVNQIYAVTCKKGIAIRGGTSVNGANIYADRCEQIAIDLRGLTYSNLTVHADGCGTDTTSNTGYPAINLQFVKGCTLTASTERHRGTEFYIQYCDGLVVNGGRSLNAVAVGASTPRIFIQDAVVQFNGYSWRYVLDNLTAADKALYTFLQEVGINSAWSFNECQGNAQWSDFPAQVADTAYIGSYKKSRYSEDSGLVKATVLHNSGAWKKLCYVANTTHIKVLSCICPVSPRYYDFTAVIRKAAVSTDSANPTILTAQQYTNDVADNGQPLQAYMGTDGWLYIKPSAGGANYDFRYVIAK